jgi:hypothetical protein
MNLVEFTEPSTKQFPLLLDRVRGEFREMPGLTLTPAQASRLLGIEPHVCRCVIDVLVQSAVLRWTPEGTIARAQ